MTTPRIYVGNRTTFRFKIVDQDGAIVDLTGATALAVLFKKPNGTIVERTGTLVTDGTDGLFEYVAETTDLDDDGSWTRQPRVTTALGPFHGDEFPFRVYAPLVVPA